MSTPQKKVAVLSTIYHPASHTDVIVSRWAKPFPTDPLYGWTQPQSKLASIYVQQKTAVSDLTPTLKLRYGVEEFDSIEDALTLGGDDLAVDAILLIGEHGDYPTNAFHQKLYPRKEFFDAVIAVFKRSGRSVPLFFDKHLSWKPEWIDEMYTQIEQMQIPFFGGSSLPFSLSESLKNLSGKEEYEEIVSIYYNSLEAYFFHNAELVECIVNRHPTILSEIDTLTAWKGQEVWEALDRGAFSESLYEAACLSFSKEACEAMKELRRNREQEVYAFQAIYRNGLKVTHFMQKDAVKKHCLAGRVKGSEIPVTGFSDTLGNAHYYPHFARLCRKIEDFFQTGIAPIPAHRLRTTSMTTAIAMQALATPGEPVSYPNFQSKPQLPK